MKKIFTLCLALLGTVATFAQSNEGDTETKGMYEFTDKDGNIVPDGSEITCNVVTKDAFGSPQIESGLYVKKVTDKDLGVSMDVNITRMDGGMLQYCFPGNCRTMKSTGSDIQQYGDKMNNNSLKTEWIPDAYGEAVASFTLNAAELRDIKGPLGIKQQQYVPIGECSTVTVRFVYADPTGINDIKDGSNIASAVAYYTADGKQLSAPQKGLNIVKLSNGKTIKVVR